MTWLEAIEAMRNGETVVHEYFTSDEYFRIQNGHLVDENGYRMAGWFKDEEWQKTGWSIK